METTLADTRRSFAKLAMLVLLAGLVWRIAQVAFGGFSTTATTANPAPVTVKVTSQPTFVRLEWINLCEPTQQGLALYTVGDNPCQPGQTASLAWLQSQLTTKGLLASTEYLEWVDSPADVACRTAVLAGPDGAPAGWVCADWRGMYRVNLNGGDSGQRLQFWSDGNWVQSR
ncbi:MAG: hypothetical protein HYZ49_17530 [Chloroflexi bacterium]|nr:hypothetical protein [Chloroflexota bacterium]